MCLVMDVERGSDIKKIDFGIKNKFQWKWIENKDNSRTFLSDYFRKIDVAGKVRCTVCNQTIKYGSSGMKALMKHGNSDAHEKASKSFLSKGKSQVFSSRERNKFIQGTNNPSNLVSSDLVFTCYCIVKIITHWITH